MNILPVFTWLFFEFCQIMLKLTEVQTKSHRCGEMKHLTASEGKIDLSCTYLESPALLNANTGSSVGVLP